jgi:phosphoglycolate phosphatase-like HAD superfamily hydrolase
MVGDLILDVMAAKSANGTCTLVRRPEQLNSLDLYPALPAEFLDDAKKTNNEKPAFGADYVVQSLTEIPAILQNRS